MGARSAGMTPHLKHARGGQILLRSALGPSLRRT
jgi:hypothetical protein